jgi:lipoprotein NlpI
MRLEPREQETILWLHLAHAWSGADDTEEIKKASDQFDRAQWPMPVVLYFLGQTDDGTLLASAAQDDKAVPPIKICEANFFIGSLASAHRDEEKAIKLLYAARDKCAHDTSTWLGADLELKRLNIATVPH